MSAHVGVELVLHGVFLPAVGTGEGVLRVLRVVGFLVGYQSTAHLEHFAALVARVLVVVAVNCNVVLYLAFVEIFCADFTLHQFSFLEHVLLGVVLHRHDAVSLELAHTVVAP